MPKKVLILVNHDVVIYNFRKELVERLLADGYQVIISSPYGERIDYLIEMGCEYIEAKIERHGTNPLNELKLLNYYKKIIRDNRPDVVLTYTIKPNIYGGLAAKKYQVPYIANITGLGTAVEKQGLMQKITILLYKFAFSNIQRVFFQNTENMQFFIDKKIAIDKHRLIPGSGVNLNYYKVLAYPKNNVTNFLFIGRVMKEKGIDEYLEAAKYIKSNYPNTQFHILGFYEGKYEAKLKSMQNKGFIQYHGMQPDVREFHKISNCTVLPSYSEGMSNALLESAACGRPIITTNISGCREIVDDGVNGYVVKRKSSQDLINKIEKFLKLNNEAKKQMGLAGRNKIEKEFSREIVIKAYMEEIEESLNMIKG